MSNEDVDLKGRTARDRLILRAKALMEHSRSNANENEAATAAEKLQALLLEHEITMAEVEDKGDDEDLSIVIDKSSVTQSYPWRRPLAKMVAEMYMCDYFYTTRRFLGSTVKHDEHSFVGAKHRVELAKNMFQYLIDTVDRLAKEGALTVSPSERSPYRTAFRAGAVLRLCRRISQRIEAAKQGNVESVSKPGTNLPAVLDLYEKTKTQLTAYMQKEFPELKTKSSKLAAELHGRGAMDGRAAGDRIGLDQQIGGGKASLRITK